MSLPACPLITFYSYKGGVGRSQTLANVAVALANRGKNVIMVDFDLESPGLHWYFSPLHAPERRLGDDELNEKGGLLDWLSKAQTVPDDEPFITDHLIECTSDALRPYQGWLKLIACGAQTVDAVSGRGYSARVRDFNWRQFEQDSYGQQYLELMRRQLQKAGADYILLDSRTGVTDVGLLCTFVLPDVVVMLFALHDQGIQGVRWLAGKLKAHREVMQAEAQEDEQVHYPQKILLVPTRVEESQELDLRDHWIQRARDAFHGEGHIWLGELGQRLPYLPKSAFGENIWVSRYKEPTELGKALESLTDSITGLSQEGEPSRPTPSFETLCSQWREWEETRRSYEDRFAFFRGIDASTSIRLISERARGLSGLNERLYLHQQELTAQLTVFTKTAGVTMDASALHPEEPETLSQHRSVWEQLEISLSQLKQKVDDRRSELRTKLKEVLDDEEGLNEELMRFEPELDAGAWQRLEERLEERIQWYRSQSIEAKLRRNELEKDQLVRRFPSDEDRTVWLEEQLQRILEDASLEEQEQLYTLRNLLRLYPTLNARPSRLLWDAWDTVCMLAELVDVPDKSTLNAQLFHESGCSLWEAEWKALLSAGSLEHGVLSSQAGAEARRQLKEIIEHSDSLVEDLSEELAGRLIKWLADDELAAVLSLVRARREDPLLLVVLEAVCELGVKTTSPWLLPLSASLLLELGVKHWGLWEPFLQILIHEGYEREAFYFLVALSHREQELATKKAELRELPTRFVLSLASEERCHPGLQALLQLPSLRQLLELNELLLYPELLTLSPILLDVEAGNTFEHFERFARHLLEYCAGRRTAAGVAEQLLETRRFDRLSQLLSSEPLPEIKQALQQAWRESLRQFEGFIEETLVTLAQLKAQGLTPQDLQELNDWLEQLRNSLDELPRVEEPKFLDALQSLGPDPFTDLKSYQGFVLDAKNACQALVLQRQEQARRRVLELKRKLDDLNNQLELQEPPLSDAQLEQLARIRIRASEGLRRRDASLLESLEAVLRQSLDAPEHLLSWSAPENPPPLSAAATVSEHRPSAAAAPSARVQGPAASELSLSPPAERFGSEPTGAPRLSPSRLRERWEQLSEWIRRELEQRKLKGKAGVSRSADDVDLRWEKERLEPHRVREESLLQLAGDMAALHADQPAGMRALAVWLLCRVFHNLQLDRFERLVELSTEALSLLELPGLKLSQHDKWVQLAQRLNVLALRLTFSGERPEGERLSELLEPELELQLNALEHRGLLPELSGVMLQLGLRESEDAVLERLLPWLRREPLPTAALLETLCEDGALLARSGLLGEASEQAWQGLRAPLIAARQGLKLLSRLDLLERGRVETVLKRLHQVDQQLQLRPALSRVRSLLDNVLEECLAPLQLEFRPMLAGVLATALQRLREELEAPSTELTGLNHRMLTTRVQVEAGLQPCLVVELHYLKGPCTLKEVQTQATLYDKGDIPIPDGLRPIPPLPRVPVGQVREVRIPLNPRAERLLEAGRLFIRQFSRGDDGKSQPLNLRVENLTVTLERGQKEDFQPAPNPFVVGTPIQRYEQIFGRDEQVEQLRQTLMGAHQDQVVMVMGERRSGKTTLLNKFKKHPLVESRYWILDVDLQHLMDAERMADFFRERFAEPIQRLLRRNGLVAPELPSFERSPGPAFSTFMGEVDVLLKKRDKRLLLVIDELEKLFENIERREQRREKDSEPESGVSELSRTTVAILRDVLQKMERVSFVLAGVTPVLRRFTTHKGERLFKLAVEVECKSLSPEACIQLICEPIKQHYEVLQLAYQHIIRETGRQPYLIQLVCSELFRYAMKHRLLHLTRLHVEQVLDELVPQRRHFSYLNDDVRDVDDYRIVRAVAMVQRGNVGVPFSDILAMLTRMGHTFQEEKLFDSLKRLELNAPQVLERRVGTRDTFRLTVGLYARHLRTLLREERW